jgi:hypothetical protein
VKQHGLLKFLVKGKFDKICLKQDEDERIYVDSLRWPLKLNHAYGKGFERLDDILVSEKPNFMDSTSVCLFLQVQLADIIGVAAWKVDRREG